jgi:acyl carrier protein
MDHKNIIEKVQTAMSDVFDIDDLQISADTTAEDIPEWDSLSHIRFMITLERMFKFKFLNEEITELKNVGDLVRVIEKKIA